MRFRVTLNRAISSDLTVYCNFVPLSAWGCETTGSCVPCDAGEGPAHRQHTCGCSAFSRVHRAFDRVAVPILLLRCFYEH